jgi:hypothetical protein
VDSTCTVDREVAGVKLARIRKCGAHFIVIRKEQKDETMQEGTGKQHAEVGKGEEYCTPH